VRRLERPYREASASAMAALNEGTGADE
jgi:hypothetical protein